MAWARALRPISRTTQAAMTTNRWRKHHLAMADMKLLVSYGFGGFHRFRRRGHPSSPWRRVLARHLRGSAGGWLLRSQAMSWPPRAGPTAFVVVGLADRL